MIFKANSELTMERYSLITGLRFRIIREKLNVSRPFFCKELGIIETSYKNIEMNYRQSNFAFIKFIFEKLVYSNFVTKGMPVHAGRLWYWLAGHGEVEDLKTFDGLFVVNTNKDYACRKPFTITDYKEAVNQFDLNALKNKTNTEE